MHLLTRDEFPLLAPNICFICESGASEQLLDSGIGFIDTGRSFNAGAPTQLSGRKYICTSCVDDAAKQLGYSKIEALDTVKAELVVAKAKLERFTAEVKSFAGSLKHTVEKGAK